MILYFADRQMNILGQASTELPDGITIIDDLKTEETDTGVSVFECRLLFNEKTRHKVKTFAKSGNYILRKHDCMDEFYTIIDTEEDTKTKEFYLYAEDAGLDLLNEIVGAFTADKAYPIEYYINMYAYDSGFQIGINEAASLTRKLSWDGESTVTERIASVATQFDNCEISYTFDIDGLIVKNKYINIHKKRGKDIGAQLRLNKDIDRIVTKESIQNLATGLKCRGDIPEDSDDPITLIGYDYDDGDIFVQDDKIYSRNALKKWSRYIWNNEPNQIADQEGHIIRTYYYETTNQSTLFAHAFSELKKYSEMEVNYEVEISKLPDNIKLGDRINIIDNDGELYVSTRILRLETSVVKCEQRATLGEFLLKNSGISEKVKELAINFSEVSVSAARALNIANNANIQAETAKSMADEALVSANNATSVATEAQTAANTATQSAQAAQTKANEAQSAVEQVEADVESLETTVANAEAVAEQAKQAAATAETKASEAQTSATEAKTQAGNAKTKATEAKTAAESATTKANTAQTTAEQAKNEAETAATTAAAAKADAEQAQKDIDAFGDDLATLSNTMSADYVRKTDLTEATASLQSQITQNAGEITSMVTQITEIDETANNAKNLSQQAQTTANEAQTKANEAAVNATAAQMAADEAKAAAVNAQTEADNAKLAAATAKSVAEQTEADLEDAKADLENITSRVDATEADITAAENAVIVAQAAADEAKANAITATQKAQEAQSKADTAAADASNAQTKANEAASAVTLAQATADEAKGKAQAAQQTADEAKENAQEAQSIANTAKTNAATAQSKADEAAATATTAQQAANDADTKAQQAASELATAQQNLADVTARVDATEADIEAAQADVEAAQTAADTAKANAEAAQTAANTAMENADNAQAVANQAASIAEAAQTSANEAKEAADTAQADVDALTVRVTSAETSITQTSERIELLATKEELTETLNEAVSQSTAVMQSCESLILSALEDYTKTGDFEEFKTTVASTLELMPQQISLQFEKSIENLKAENAALNNQMNTITNYFTFDINGMTIGQVDNPYKIVISNDRYSMLVSGVEIMWIANGETYTPKLTVTERMTLLGYIAESDSNGLVNWNYIS